MRETELAFAISARDWPERVHRFLADHGGARVRLTALGPEDVETEAFDVLLIDDSCSFLTPRLVSRVHSLGRVVVGVYDPDEFPDGKDRLLECGVGDVVEAGADPEEYLAVVSRVRGAALVVEHPPQAEAAAGGLVVAVGGPAGGVGVTEVAVTVSRFLGASLGGAVLVDLDPAFPAVAARLGLPLHPNLLTALDLLAHRVDRLEEALQQLDDQLGVIPGVTGGGDVGDLRGAAVADLVSEVARRVPAVVVDLGRGWQHPGAMILRRVDRLVGVGAASPVGVIRLTDWLAGAESLWGSPADIVINRAPRRRFHREEIVSELTRSYRPASFVFLPEDRAVTEAAWSAGPVRRSRYRKTAERWAERYLLSGVRR